MSSRAKVSQEGDAIAASLPRIDLPASGVHDRYPSSVPAWARPKSPSSSIRSRSSRAPSPVDNQRGQHSQDSSAEDKDEDVLALSAGCQADMVYKLSLPAWRYRIRKTLVKGVEWESPILARIQVSSLSEGTSFRACS